MKIKLLSLCLGLFTNALFGQSNWCGFDACHQSAIDSNPSINWEHQQFIQQLEQFRQDYQLAPKYNSVQSRAACPKRRYVIPVAFHVIHDPADNVVGVGSNISEQQILDQLTILNNAFANAYGSGNIAKDADIYFCMPQFGGKNAIFRYSNTLTDIGDDEMHRLDSLKGSFPNSEYYINIYIVRSIVSQTPGETIWGLASHPLSKGTATQGILLRHQACGDASASGNTYNLYSSSRGMALVHEMGHYFGLWHPFQTGCLEVATSNCSGLGDLCCDVPPTSGANYSGTPSNTCHETPDKNDMIENFMDYSPDAVRTTFTADQITLMHYTLLNLRSGLLNTDSLSEKKVPCGIYSGWFQPDVTELCDSGTVTFTAIRSHTMYVGYFWWIYKNGQLVYSSDNDPSQSSGYYKRSIKFTDTGKYTVKLKMKPSQCDTVELTRENVLIVKPCGPILHDPNAIWNFGYNLSLEYHQFGTIPTLNGLNVNPKPGNQSAQTAISVSDTSGTLRFYGGSQIGPSNLPLFNKEVKLWYSDTVLDWNFMSPRSVTETIKGSGNSIQNLVLPRPGHPEEYWWFTMHNGQIIGSMYYRAIALDTGNHYDISGNANIPLKGPVGFPGDSFGAVYTTEAISATTNYNDSFYWLFLKCPGNKGTTFDSSLAIFKVFEDTVIFFDTFTGRNVYYQVIKVSPDGRYVFFDARVYEFNRKTGALSLKYDFFDYNTTQYTYEARNEIRAAEFSPNSRFLYLTRGDNQFPSSVDSLFQIDLDNENPYESRALLSILPNGHYLKFQITPDQRIVLMGGRRNDLDVINQPDSLCTSSQPNKCDLSIRAIHTTFPGRSDMGVGLSLPDPVFTQTVNKLRPRISVAADSCYAYQFSHNVIWDESSTWYFGDGGQTVGREVSHTYLPGIYEVKCLIGTDTVRTTIRVRQKSFTIIGRQTTCDSNQAAFYSVLPDDDFMDYNWGANGGNNIYSSTSKLAAISWVDTGYIFVNLTDRFDACVYTDTMFTVPQAAILNNAISGDTLFCGGLLSVTGSNPSGGDSNFTYSWIVRRNGTDYALDSFTKSLLNYSISTLPFSNCYLHRFVNSNGCYNISNPLKIITPEIANHVKTIPNGCNDYLTDADSLNRIPGANYQWQYSIDSLSWQSISGQNAGSYMVSGKSWPKRFFRRILNLPGCGYDTSNIIKIEGFIYIANQPVDAAGCDNMAFQLFADVVDNRKIASTFRWQYLNGLDWTNLSVNIGGAPLLIDTASKYPHGISFRLKIENACFSIFSNSVILKKTVNPTIISTDHSHNANSNSSLKLKGQWAGERNVCYAVWQRSTNPIGTAWDSMGKTAEDSFEITVPEFTKCQQRWYYRLALRNLCPPTGKKYWDNEVASSAIEVGAYQNSTYLQDLWVPDSRADNGTEPNLIDTQNYTHSHRLWNRNWADKYQLVDNWTDRVDLQTDRDTNFIHLMVYNRGDSSVSQGDIYFYWTVMSVNEDWPYSWTGAAEFKNLDHPNGSNGSNKFNNASGYKTYPLGGRINKTTIELNSFLNQAPAITPHPAYNGMLKPGDSILITYPWVQADTVPQPGWYYGIVNKQHMYSNHIGLCLLARIQECESPTYGMTYPEKIHYGNQSNGSLTYKGNIGYNILMNNNIVSSNFYLGYMDPPFIGTPQVWTLGSVKRPDTGIVGTRDLKFNFCVNDPIFYNHGEVVITPTDDFWYEFQTSSYPGSGFSINAADHQIIVHDPCADIGPIQVPDTFSTMLGFTWRYLPNSNHSGSLLNSLFTLKEYNESELIGITQYGVKSHLNSNGGNNGGGQGAPMPQIKDSTRSKSSNNNYKLQVHPNPFDNLIEIEYSGLPNGEATVLLLNAHGSIVHVISECKLDDKGFIRLHQAYPALAPGVYNIKVIEGQRTSVEKLIKIE